MLGKAIAIASQAFKDDRDKGGNPYILHCIRVMMSVSNEDEDTQIAAILHDLLEDKPDLWTPSMLRNEGFSTKCINAIIALTHMEGTDYDTYIKLISFNPIAVKVKLADLKDNMDPTRLKGLTSKDFSRMEKYQRSFHYLSKV